MTLSSSRSLWATVCARGCWCSRVLAHSIFLRLVPYATDFLPALPLVEIDDGGLEFLLETYRKVAGAVPQGEPRPFLVNTATGQIDKHMLKAIIAALTKREQDFYLAKLDRLEASERASLAAAAGVAKEPTVTASSTTSDSPAPAEAAAAVPADPVATPSEAPAAASAAEQKEDDDAEGVEEPHAAASSKAATEGGDDEDDEVERAIRALVQKKKLEHSQSTSQPAKGPSLLHLIRPVPGMPIPLRTGPIIAVPLRPVPRIVDPAAATAGLKQLLHIDASAPASIPAPAPESTDQAAPAAVPPAEETAAAEARDPAQLVNDARGMHYLPKARLPTCDSPTGVTEFTEELLSKVVFNYIEGYGSTRTLRFCYGVTHIWYSRDRQIGMGVALLLSRCAIVGVVLSLPLCPHVARYRRVHGRVPSDRIPTERPIASDAATACCHSVPKPCFVASVLPEPVGRLADRSYVVALHTNPLSLSLFPRKNISAITWYPLTRSGQTCLEYYPRTFEFHADEKGRSWKSIPLVPFVDAQLLIECTSKLQALLSPQEQLRNAFGPGWVFSYSKYAEPHDRRGHPLAHCGWFGARIASQDRDAAMPLDTA